MSIPSLLWRYCRPYRRHKMRSCVRLMALEPQPRPHCEMCGTTVGVKLLKNGGRICPELSGRAEVVSEPRGSTDCPDCKPCTQCEGDGCQWAYFDGTDERGGACGTRSPLDVICPACGGSGKDVSECDAHAPRLSVA